MTALSILAARCVRVFATNHPPRSKRAQGRPGAGWHPWSACSKKARGRTTGSAESSGLPCAMVLRLIRDLPGDRAFLPPSPARCGSIFADLTPASGRQDHATSPSAINHSSRDLSRPSHPASYVRDDRETPLLWIRDARMIALIWGKRQCPSGCGRLARRATQFSCCAVIASEGRCAVLSTVIPGRRARTRVYPSSACNDQVGNSRLG